MACSMANCYTSFLLAQIYQSLYASVLLHIHIEFQIHVYVCILLFVYKHKLSCKQHIHIFITIYPVHQVVPDPLSHGTHTE